MDMNSALDSYHINEIRYKKKRERNAFFVVCEHSLILSHHTNLVTKLGLGHIIESSLTHSHIKVSKFPLLGFWLMGLNSIHRMMRGLYWCTCRNHTQASIGRISGLVETNQGEHLGDSRVLTWSLLVLHSYRCPIMGLIRLCWK